MLDFKWKDESATGNKKNDQIQSYLISSQRVEEYYDKLRENKINSNNKVKLTYRRGQHKFSRDVMNSIKNNEILIVQAGVGIGKSIGYLIPIFYTYDNVEKFNKIVISTSSIALQQQLLTDINFVSNLLGIDVKVSIAKGINNYVCLNKIENAIRSSRGDEKKELIKIYEEMLEKSTIDKDEFKKINDQIWDKIRMRSRGACKNCYYSRDCLYKEIESNINESNIVITNHGNFVNSVVNGSEYIDNSDMMVFDEVHKLEENLNSNDEGSLDLDYLKSILDFYINNIVESNDMDKIINFKRSLELLFLKIMKNAKYNFNKNKNKEQDINITDCERIIFTINNIVEDITNICNELNDIMLIIKQYNYKNGYTNDYRLNILMEYFLKFNDIKSGRYSDNIYWVNFYKSNRINIGYRKRDNSNISKKIFQRNIPIICTSGTILDSKGKYDYFKQSLNLDKISPMYKTITDGRVLRSPYDYDNNSIFYYDSTVSNPRTHYQNYIEDLTSRIRDLISLTNGRTLILFTSKKSMNEVYDKLKNENFGFEIMIQGESSDYSLCKKFETNVKSCLFATGSFWEGIDIKGKALSSVIITRLPFSNTDAVTESKVMEYSSKDAFDMVYLNAMLEKLSQGTGRLIRRERDKGIICCLDPRFPKYIEQVKNCTPFTNFTNDINEIIEFSNKYITNRDKKIKTKKRS